MDAAVYAALLYLVLAVTEKPLANGFTTPQEYSQTTAESDIKTLTSESTLTKETSNTREIKSNQTSPAEPFTTTSGETTTGGSASPGQETTVGTERTTSVPESDAAITATSAAASTSQEGTATVSESSTTAQSTSEISQATTEADTTTMTSETTLAEETTTTGESTSISAQTTSPPAETTTALEETTSRAETTITEIETTSVGLTSTYATDTTAKEITTVLSEETTRAETTTNVFQTTSIPETTTRGTVEATTLEESSTSAFESTAVTQTKPTTPVADTTTEQGSTIITLQTSTAEPFTTTSGETTTGGSSSPGQETTVSENATSQISTSWSTASFPTTFLTTSGSTTQFFTSTTSPTSTPTTPNPSIQCKNGGTWDGNKCICLPDYYGSVCEFLIDRVNVEKANTSTSVTLTIVNAAFNENFLNNSTMEYKIFEARFKEEMRTVYGNVSGYVDVEIISLKRGSIVVEHNVIVEVELKSSADLDAKYNNVVIEVEKQLIGLNCTNGNAALCLDGNIPTVDKIPPPTAEELCRMLVEPKYAEYYRPLETPGGLICITDCYSESRNYINCTIGLCQVESTKGPQCYCPHTEKYIYMYDRCQGQILKAGLYGGLGAGFALLLIIFIIIGFVIYRTKHWRKWDVSSESDEARWYEDTDDIWPIKLTFDNHGAVLQEDDISNNGSQSTKSSFQPNLKNVDTTITVNISRPEMRDVQMAS